MVTPDPNKKLTPRVGDRVLVNHNGRTYVGDVVPDPTAGSDINSTMRVAVDGRGTGSYEVSNLTVVDREPVGWPEGWSSEPNYILGPMAFHEPTNLTFTKDMLEDILATGPDMLARWDELMDGEA